MMDITHGFDWLLGLRLVLALALGLLIGLERERSRSETKRLIFGGVRTFPLISIFGFACAWLYLAGLTWMPTVGLMAVLGLAAVAYAGKLRDGRIGATSEVAVLVTYITGLLTLLADIRLAMTLGVITTILLSEKAALESLVERLDKAEFLAMLRFLLVTFIIYPVLPDQDFTDFHLNPVRIWRMVVLVSSLGFAGYFLIKKFGSRVGLWLSGLVGGIVSSTAVSIATGRIAQAHPARGAEALQATLLASSVMYLRVLALLAFFNVTLASALVWQLGALAGLGLLLALSALRPRGATANTPLDQPAMLQNPFEIRPAIVFAALFVMLTILTNFAKAHFGNAGVLSLAGFSGLVDVDPFILSLAQGTEATAHLAAQAIIVALMSNTLVKGVYFATLAQGLRAGALLRYGLWTLAHVPLLWSC
ncbi:MAG: MgtC/SapB family protein [Kiritimatiellaeota bacterium]|nr:MgtC/SapB family protein [Kiritimatiellota bacterium]